MFSFTDSSSEDTEPPLKFQEMGFDSTNFVFNLGAMYVYILIYPFVILSLFLIEKQFQKRCMNRMVKVRKFVKDTFLFGFILRILIEGSLTVTLTALLHIVYSERKNKHILVYASIYVMIIAVVALIPGSYLFLKSNKKHLRDKQFKIKYGTLYENVLENSQLAIIYTPLMIIRRVAIVLLIYVFEGLPN